MPSKLDLSGKVINNMLCEGFSHMTNHGKTAWVFRCHCDSLFTAIGSNVCNKRTNSCGICVKTENLTSQKFGEWTVMSKAEYKETANGKRICMWACRCSCGAESKISTASLRNGSSKSCGNCISVIDAGLNQIFIRYKSEAKSNGRDFFLTQEQFKKLIQSNCDYCKRQPSNKKKLKRKTLDYIVYNGVDRVDSSRGYTLDNCVPCCYKCNIAKSDMTRAEFFEWILEVAKQIAGNKASENSSSGWGE